MRWPWSRYRGSCKRVEPPKKSVLSVNSVTATWPSAVQRSTAFEIPISGLNAQRLVPMLSSRLGAERRVGEPGDRALHRRAGVRRGSRERHVRDHDVELPGHAPEVERSRVREHEDGGLEPR